jgi:chorismate mutase/prephenate dehydratase
MLPLRAMPNPAEDLERVRDAILAIDREILARLRARMELVDEIARTKLDRAVPFRDQHREEQVLQRVRHVAVELGLDAHEIERLYRLVLEMSIARQRTFLHALDTAPLRIAYQGVEGSYTHLAAQRRYGGRRGGVLLDGYDTFRLAVLAVLEGSADLALLPIENTTAGSINETYDLLAEGGIVITGEEVSHIEHCLLGLPGAALEELRTVISHPQALSQCDAFLHAHPAMVPRAEFDTAGAARAVREAGDRTMAAIASESAAGRYGLAVLARGIQNQAGNYTRFVEVAREPIVCPPDAPTKTSLVLTLNDRPGALGQVLLELSRRGINLTKLESRPIHGSPWNYRFYLDLEGHAASGPVSDALAVIAPLAAQLRVLGAYPRAPESGEGSPPTA